MFPGAEHDPKSKLWLKLTAFFQRDIKGTLCRVLTNGKPHKASLEKMYAIVDVVKGG